MLTKETLMKLNMSFLIKDDEFLEKHNEIWEKVKNSLKRVYNEKIKTYFHNNVIPKEGSQFIC